MKQKNLTEHQIEVLKKLEDAFKEANENNIGFVYDENDCSLTAYNAENVIIPYCGRCKESDNDERMDWDSTHMVANFSCDYFNCGFDDYYLNFTE